MICLKPSGQMKFSGMANVHNGFMPETAPSSLALRKPEKIMHIRKMTGVAIAAALLAIPVVQANAWTITYNSDAKQWSGKCKDGHSWIIGNGATQPSEEAAARICAKHGGLSTADDDGQARAKDMNLSAQ